MPLFSIILHCQARLAAWLILAGLPNERIERARYFHNLRCWEAAYVETRLNTAGFGRSGSGHLCWLDSFTRGSFQWELEQLVMRARPPVGNICDFLSQTTGEVQHQSCWDCRRDQRFEVVPCFWPGTKSHWMVIAIFSFHAASLHRKNSSMVCTPTNSISNIQTQLLMIVQLQNLHRR